MYIWVKYLHVSCALISVSLFILRVVWSVAESPLLQRRWAKIVPHLNDTLLLSCAVYLVVASGQNPFSGGWLTAKLAALFVYIILGSFAIKYGRSVRQRCGFAVLALFVFVYIVWVALCKPAVVF